MALSNDFFSNAIGGKISPIELTIPRIKTAGGVYMAQLGDFQFSLETAAFEMLARSTEYRWATQNRIGRSPASQFIGQGADTIELHGTIYPHFRGGIGQIGSMREIASEGSPLPLIYAFENIGQYCGLWCIKAIKDNRSEFIREGAAKKIEFSLTLEAYGEDEMSEAEIMLRVLNLMMSADAGIPPLLSGSVLSSLLQNGLKVDGLVDVFSADWGEGAGSKVADFLSAVSGATGGASLAASAKSAIVQLAISNGKIAGAIPSLSTALNDLLKVNVSIADVNRDTAAIAKLVRSSPADFRSAAQLAATQMRQVAQNAVAVTGRIDSAYQSGVDDIMVGAGLANVIRAGQVNVYAAIEAARQLEVIAGKIKV